MTLWLIAAGVDYCWQAQSGTPAWAPTGGRRETAVGTSAGQKRSNGPSGESQEVGELWSCQE